MKFAPFGVWRLTVEAARHELDAWGDVVDVPRHMVWDMVSVIPRLVISVCQEKSPALL